MARLLSVAEYETLFAAAFPDLSPSELGFQHAANAIAAFEVDAFTLTDSPWDRYLRGDVDALSTEAKRGAKLFYGKANCGSCHSGMLMTDQGAHALAVPQIGLWTHAGAYTTLEGVVRHHLDPEDGLRNYDEAQLEPRLRGLVDKDPARRNETILAARADIQPVDLSDDEVRDILAFLFSLTDPAARNLGARVPDRVPSGMMPEGL